MIGIDLYKLVYIMALKYTLTIDKSLSIFPALRGTTIQRQLAFGCEA